MIEAKSSVGATDLPPGAVIVPTGGSVSDDTAGWLASAPLPPGSLLEPVIVTGSDPARNRNTGVRTVFDALPHLDWVLFVDTDQAPGAGDALALVRAAVRRGAGAAAGVVAQRASPFDLNAYATVSPTRRRVTPSEVLAAPDGLDVEACGAGFLLVTRRALRAVALPDGAGWFRWGGEGSEDVDLTLRVHRAGLPVIAVGCIRPGHHCRVTVYLGGDGRVWAELPGPHRARVPLGVPGEVGLT